MDGPSLLCYRRLCQCACSLERERECCVIFETSIVAEFRKKPSCPLYAYSSVFVEPNFTYTFERLETNVKISSGVVLLLFEYTTKPSPDKSPRLLSL